MNYSITHPKLYGVWCQMLRRCEDPSAQQYKDYGGRGISVCERWHWFGNFLLDMGEPKEGLTLEREDNDGNYEPNNCKWATRSEQQFNKRMHANNKSGLSGVYWMEANQNWQVKFGKTYLGTFSTLLNAAAVRKSAENKRGL